MGEVIGFSCRSILTAAVNAIGGTELAFENVAWNNSFKMRLLFAIPSTVDAAVMEEIAVVGQMAGTEHDAEESVCAAALHVLWLDHRRVVVDYSLLRVWCCKERHSGLLEKLQHSKLTFEDVSTQALGVIDSLLPASVYFAGKANDMRNSGADDAIVGSVTACVGFLQMMHVRGRIVREQAVVQFQGMNNHGNLQNLLHAEGFILPDNNDDLTRLGGGLRMMMDRVADAIGYNQPTLRTQSRGDRHKCFFDFSPAVGSGRRQFTAAGRVSFSVCEATDSGAYNALLALSVNHNVEIGDVNREAYLFARERVLDIGSDLELLGNAGSSICSYFNTTRRGLRMMISSYCPVLRRHQLGEELVEKLESVASEVHECLTGITAPVRSMNEDAVVGSLPF